MLETFVCTSGSTRPVDLQEDCSSIAPLHFPDWLSFRHGCPGMLLSRKPGFSLGKEQDDEKCALKLGLPVRGTAMSHNARAVESLGLSSPE
jgi:hypothetical protein